MRNVLLWGVTNISTNYGVEGIVRGTCKIFEQEDVTFIFRTESMGRADYNRFSDVKNLRVENVSYFRRIPFLRKLERLVRYIRFKKSNNKLILGGLKNIDEIFIIGGDLYTEANKDKNWIYPEALVYGVKKIVKAKKEFTIWGASIGPFKQDTLSNLGLRKHFTMAKGIYVREDESFRYVTDVLGLDNVFLIPDPAFAMKVPKVERSNYMCVNLSPGPFEYVYGQEISESINLLQEFLLERLKTDNELCVKLLPHVGRDHAFMSGALVTLLNHPRVEIVQQSIGALATKNLIAGSRLVICSRFHCSIAGFSSQTPTLLLISAPKGRKLLNHIFGDCKFGIEIKDLSPEYLDDRINDVLKNEEMIRQTLANMNASYSEEFNKVKSIVH